MTDTSAGTSLAAHFAAKRRIFVTVKQMNERGEEIEEATREEMVEAASKSAETAFKFEFATITDQAPGTKCKRTRKRMKRKQKRRAQGEQEDDKMLELETVDVNRAPLDVGLETVILPQGPAKDMERRRRRNSSKGQQQVQAGQVQAAKGAPFVKLRKATGTESEVAKMHLRYGQGRRNPAATKQRQQRQKAGKVAAGATRDFKFNFLTML
uniref:Uncharacterized protein n=1 Tax=Peronospora matthiolae TaxID=2874970 RepID=A0AAV1U1V2_9STRA